MYNKTKHELDQEFGTLQSKEYFCVLDLELTCWDKDDIYKRTVKKDGEIIDIGVVVLDRDYKEIGSFESVVKPMYHSHLSDYCKDLTGITQKEIDYARNLLQVVGNMADSLPSPEDYVWVSWGKDPEWLVNEFNKKRCTWAKEYRPIQIEPRYVNLGHLYKYKRKGSSLCAALNDFNIIQSQPAHRALSDAKSTALLTQHIKPRFMDCMENNSKTYQERKDFEENRIISMLQDRTTGVDKKLARYVLDTVQWDFSKAKHLIETIQEQFLISQGVPRLE